MKKLISSLLVLAMLLSMSSPALAFEVLQGTPKLLEEYTIDTGIYYSYSANYCDQTWSAIIFVPNDGRNISFSATPVTTSETREQNEEDDGIYMLSLAPSATSGAIEYLEEGFALLHEASVISVSSFESREDAMEKRDSIQADLFNELRQIYGNEYAKIVCRYSTFPNIRELAIHDDLVFRMSSEGNYLFSPGTSLSVIVQVLGNALPKGVNITLSFVATALSITGEYTEGNKTVDLYLLEADFGRWTTIDGGSYIYTMANKIYRHCGLNERNNETRAYVQDTDTEPFYMPSVSYYNNYSAQANEAYDLYVRMNS